MSKGKRVVRHRKTNLSLQDEVEVRIRDEWLGGRVSRSTGGGAEVDVRLHDGRVMKNLTAKDVRRAPRPGSE